MPAEHTVVSKGQSLYKENSKVIQDCQDRKRCLFYKYYIYFLNYAILSSLFYTSCSDNFTPTRNKKIPNIHLPKITTCDWILSKDFSALARSKRKAPPAMLASWKSTQDGSTLPRHRSTLAVHPGSGSRSLRLKRRQSSFLRVSRAGRGHVSDTVQRIDDDDNNAAVRMIGELACM